MGDRGEEAWSLVVRDQWLGRRDPGAGGKGVWNQGLAPAVQPLRN
jgi:hypothetical protein